MDWESQLLLKSCKEKKCLDKGLAILYEYAGHIDLVKWLVDERTEKAKELFQNHSSDHETIRRSLEDLAVCNIQLFIALGNWRGLQWSPKTVLCQISVPNVNNDGKFVWSLRG